MGRLILIVVLVGSLFALGADAALAGGGRRCCAPVACCAPTYCCAPVAYSAPAPCCTARYGYVPSSYVSYYAPRFYSAAYVPVTYSYAPVAYSYAPVGYVSSYSVGGCCR